MICDDHLGKLGKALDQLAEILHQDRGTDHPQVNVMDCFMLIGELGTVNDQRPYMRRCWSTPQEGQYYVSRVDQTNTEVKAAFQRIGCSEN